jgi:hypothetical protein
MLVGAAANLALLASASAAQVCQGDLSFRSGRTHVGGALELSDHATAFGAGMNVGQAQGLFGGGSLGTVDYDQLGTSLSLGGSLGYSMPFHTRSTWQVCPGGTLNLGFGPSVPAGVNQTARLSTQTITLGASIGSALPLNKDITLLPFGSAALGHTSAGVAGFGSRGDSYLQLGFGAGFQFSPSLVLKPALTLLAGADPGTDDTIFSLSVSFLLPR